MFTKVTNPAYKERIDKKQDISARIGDMNFVFAHGRDKSEYEQLRAKGVFTPAIWVLIDSIDPDVILQAFTAQGVTSANALARKYAAYFTSTSLVGKSLYAILKPSERDALEQMEEDRSKKESTELQLGDVLRMYKHVRKYALNPSESSPYSDYDQYLLALFCKYVNNELLADISSFQPQPSVTPPASPSQSEVTPEQPSAPRPITKDNERLNPRYFAKHIHVKIYDEEKKHTTEFDGVANATSWVFNPEDIPDTTTITLYNSKTNKTYLYRGTKKPVWGWN